MRMFCTSGPVDKKTCYYVERPDITEEALNHIERWEYFNIIAPAHSGKTTFLRMLEEKIKDKYLPMYVSFKDYKNIENSEDFVNKFFESIEINNKLKRLRDIENYFYELHEEQKKDIILMIDDYNELDNKEVLNDLLHIIRAMFHKKELYGLRSVIISGTEYIPIFPDDPASPYNIAYEMEFPYFTKEQVYDLLSQHEKETGQIF
ncbi:transcriptional regulator, partial [Marinitoga sp. 1135]